MKEHEDSKPQSAVARRSFLARVGTGVTVLSAAAAIAPRTVAAQTPAGTRFEPARHEVDDWMDQLGNKHRLVFDTTASEGVTSATLYASNFFAANQSGYNLKNEDLGVIVVMRHNSTSFAYNDAIWAKYGASLSTATKLVDPQTQMPPIVNIYKRSIDGVVRQGVHFAVCMMATRNNAGIIARATGGNTDAVYNEIVANLVPNAHMVPAGIVAVSRAQERGYTFVHAV